MCTACIFIQPDTDVVVGGADSQGSFVFDGLVFVVTQGVPSRLLCVQCVIVRCILYYRYASGRLSPTVDSQEDLTESSAVHENGVTRISFSRKLVTGDTGRDFDLTDDLFWLFAYGGTFSGSNPGSIGYHSSNRGVIPGGKRSLMAGMYMKTMLF